MTAVPGQNQLTHRICSATGSYLHDGRGPTYEVVVEHFNIVQKVHAKQFG